MAIFYFVLGLLLFIGLVLVHEWGHFIMARRNGVDVEEFGLGFPPRAKILAKKNGTIYSLNWLPLGGFVKLKGEHDIDTEKGTFGAAGTKAKIKIMLAGVVMNLLTAWLIFTVVALIGMPKIIKNQFSVGSDTKITQSPLNEGVIKIGAVVEGSPAERAGILVEDQLVSINKVSINEPESVSEQTEANKGKTVLVEFRRGEETISKDITLNETSPYLGIGPYSAQTGFEVRRSTWSAPIVAVGVSKDFTLATLNGLGKALKGLGSAIAGLITGNDTARKEGQAEASDQVSGPVGIFAVLYEISRQGIGLVLFIIGLISLTLAIMNVLPIPALDGGRLFVTLLYRAVRRPLKPSTEDRIHGTGFAVLMLLFVLITIVDVKRFL
ncbi:site-2 protease family protein [Candidatus Saccharibacteria bacterium]|nr:site-2 protease family protein [Candidatus Saccharibacteria bacterium]